MTNSSRCDFLAAYGTLRRRSLFNRLPLAASRLHFVGYGRIRGRLFWQRAFPAVVQDRGIVGVELFQIVDPSVWGDLDFYEGFDPINLGASLFIRRQVLLLNPRLWAWGYFLGSQMPRGIQQRDTENISPQRHKGREGLKPKLVLWSSSAKSVASEWYDRRWDERDGFQA